MPWQREATEDWQDRFEALARAKNIEDNAIDGQHPSSKMMDLFLTLIGKDAYAQIKTLVAPEKPHMKTYGDVKRLINANFGADLEIHLRDPFVVGLEDESVVRKLLLEEALTFSKAVQIAGNAEEVRGLQQSMRGESTISVLRQKKTQSSSRQRDNGKEKTSSSITNCRFCGGDHARRQCPAWGKVCHKCKRRNHFSKMCHSSVDIIQNEGMAESSKMCFLHLRKSSYVASRVPPKS